MWDTEARAGENSASELEWVGLDSDRESRRWMAGTTAVVVGAMLLISTLAFAPGASAHATFTANDVYVTSNGGNLQSLTVAPDGDVHYDGLESVPSGADVEVQMKLANDSTWETVGSKNVSATGQQGDITFNFSTIDVLANSSLTKADFKAAGDGTNQTTTVDIRVVATLYDSGENGNDVTATSATSFDVEVQNEKISTSAGGKANTNGN